MKKAGSLTHVYMVDETLRVDEITCVMPCIAEKEQETQDSALGKEQHLTDAQKKALKEIENRQPEAYEEPKEMKVF